MATEENDMSKRKKMEESLPFLGGEAAGRVPTHWDPASDPTYSKFMKDAKVAGKKGVPDPSRSTQAPSCFQARYAVAEDQLHHEVNELLAEIEPIRKVLASLSHVEEQVASSDTMTEAQERRLVQLSEAREQLLSRVQRSESRMRSIVAVHSHVVADMKEMYRKYYPFADHFDMLVFPVLDLRDLRYGDDDGPGLGALMPSQPTKPTAGKPSMLERKGEWA